MQKFIKRKQNGRWSELNKERVRRLKGDAVSKEASETTNNQTYWYAIIADTLKEERYVNNGDALTKIIGKMETNMKSYLYIVKR